MAYSRPKLVDRGKVSEKFYGMASAKKLSEDSLAGIDGDPKMHGGKLAKKLHDRKKKSSY